LDPDVRKKSTLDSKFLFQDPLYTPSQLERVIGNYTDEEGNHPDIDKIFKAVGNSWHWDYGQNANIKNPLNRKVSLIHYEYTRYMYVPLTDPEIKDVVRVGDKILMVRRPEKRIVLAAGDQKFYDKRSPLHEIDLWTFVSFMNDKLRTNPYAYGNFKSERSVQDMLNVILTLIFNSQARQTSKPIVAVSMAISNKDQFEKGLTGEKPAIYLDYTQDMMDAGIKPRDLMPDVMNLGAVDIQTFQIFESIWNKYQTVGLQEVLKGSTPAGVTSGTAITQLQSAGMQPAIYHKRKLEPSYGRLGAVIWEFTKHNLKYEVEVPIEGDSGEIETITLNHIVEKAEWIELIQKAQNGDEKSKERFKMISIRVMDKDDKVENRLSMDEFLKKYGQEFTPGVPDKNGRQIEFVENDLQFGEWDVNLTIDTMAEQNKMQKIEQVKIFMPLIAQTAPRTALKYALEKVEEPQRHEILKEYDEEDQVRKIGLKAMEAMKQAEAMNSAAIPEGQPVPV
jgi:hypothetical protein